MKLFFAAASPFARKVTVCAAELGIALERVPAAPHPINRDRGVVAQNPLGKVPTAIADDGTVLYDSRVICEYLDAQGGGGRLFPAPGLARWRALTEQSLADGLMDAGILLRYEALTRPAELQSEAWKSGQMEKVTCALDELERLAPDLGDRVDIGTIAIGCALGWLDFRFGDLGWRTGRPGLAAWFGRFEQRPSMAGSKPAA
ncbi:glutathione S-transferase N-terminal domain-containing protein [Paracraurococcus lichenis]|uniref:Glutathione S-transferase N-terminal domain-containing protein n=1 Tax=Paracraurococcus lichenis TaxID=3064888 RepID=A0ABT9DTQ8_9PROT|nr:glutathione S-transferase N-terminal domain-containing protein [Paracraurococcus sp. LOR1-02]MDO9707291.1 glutathione S-transferase N-terminal domain-containing protein [Paracraurococcus sp. LOR1-02]